MRIVSLFVAPVKSMGGYDLEEAELEPWGLRDDRRWAVVAGDEVLTARELPRMLHFRPRPVPGGLRITAPDGRETQVATPTAGVPDDRWGVGRVRDAGDDAAAWLSDALGTDVRLVHQGDPAHDRPVKPKHGGREGDTFNLTDCAPLLLTSQKSLQQLDEWIDQTARDRDEPSVAPLDMQRFRPNIVIDGETPYAEDGWREVRVGEVDLRFAECCDRCVMTTYDPTTLTRSHEPIRTLARHRSWDGATWFGVRFVPLTTGTLRVGDELLVRSTAG